MRGVLILAILIAVSAAQNQIIPTFMICGSPGNTNIVTNCKLWHANNGSNDIALPFRPVPSAPYCNEINFESQIVVNGSATVSCSIATQKSPYQYAVSMYDPTFSGQFTSNVGFPFLVNPGKTWTVNFSSYQEWINNNKNQVLTGYQYISSSNTWNNFQVTGTIWMNFGQSAVQADPRLIKNLDKYFM